MKKIFKLSYIFVAAMMALTACDDDYEYSPAGEPVVTSSMTFAEGLAYSAELAPEDNEIELTVLRASAEGSEKVGLDIVGADCFEVPASVSFEEGQTRASFILKINDKMKYFTRYTVTLRLRTNEYDPANNGFITLTLSKNDYTDVATGVYKSQLPLFGGWSTTLQYSATYDQYRLGEWITPGYDLFFKWEKGAAEVTMLQPEYETGYTHSTYGLVTGKCIPINEAGDVALFQNDTFYFGFYYYLSGGYFGNFLDTFQVTSWNE